MRATAASTAARAALLLLLPYVPTVLARTPDCGNVLTPPYPYPVVGGGWTARLVATGLKDPRGLLFDPGGNLLVVERRAGIRRLSFDDGGGTCLVLAENTQVIRDDGVGFLLLLFFSLVTREASSVYFLLLRLRLRLRLLLLLLLLLLLSNRG